jgi:energy-coupling factor transporter transmembrane protein EcfT
MTSDTQYFTKRSILAGRDPRILILLLLTIVVITFLVGRPSGLIVLFAYVALLAALADVGLRRAAVYTRRVLLFIVVIVVVNAFLVDGTPLPDPFSFFSREGFAAGLYYSLRVLVLLATTAVLLTALPPEGFAAGVSSLLRPFAPALARTAAFHTFLSMGFLPLCRDEAKRISDAQSFRGGGQAGVLRKLFAVRLLVVPLIASAIRRSDQLAVTVHLRNIEARMDRLTAIGSPDRADAALVGVTLAVLVVAVTL